MPSLCLFRYCTPPQHHLIRPPHPVVLFSGMENKQCWRDWNTISKGQVKARLLPGHPCRLGVMYHCPALSTSCYHLKHLKLSKYQQLLNLLTWTSKTLVSTGRSMLTLSTLVTTNKLPFGYKFLMKSKLKRKVWFWLFLCSGREQHPEVLFWTLVCSSFNSNRLDLWYC